MTFYLNNLRGKTFRNNLGGPFFALKKAKMTRIINTYSIYNIAAGYGIYIDIHGQSAITKSKFRGGFGKI